MIKTTTEHTKQILEDQRDSIEAELMMKNDLIKRVYNKDLPFSFIYDTGLCLYGFDVKNKYEVISFDYEKDCFRCATTCGVTNKRRTENTREDSLIDMIKGNFFNKKEESKKLDFMKIMGAS